MAGYRDDQPLLFDLHGPAANAPVGEAERHDASGPVVQLHPQGIYLAEPDLWLDPLVERPAAFISHAHSDHARAVHGWALATAATHDFMAARGRACPGPRQDYGAVHDRLGCRLTLFPAGHVLGSAQLLCETPWGRVVYTGDCKLSTSLANGPDATIVPCDTLIIEATFGLPIYRFWPIEKARARIVNLAREALGAGEIPVFLGYSLGKGPEIARILQDAQIPVRVWGSLIPLLRIYQQHGVDFSAVLETTAQAPLDGMAMVIPPSARLHPGITRIRNRRVVYVSGWASVDAAYHRMDADALVPMSDHFDWPALLYYIEQASPSRVLVTHGYCEPLARYLREQGVRAEAIHLPRGDEEAD